MRLVILGAGAIGGVLAGYLARAHRDVLLLARGPQLEAIRVHGLRVEAPGQPFTVTPEVADSRGPIAWRPDDVVVVAVKTHDVAAALRELAAPSDLPIVCMTNGLEAERLALRHARAVYGAYVMMPATYLTPGVVHTWVAPMPGLLDLGRYPDGTGDHADAIVGELVVAGFGGEVRPNIMKWKRGKLLSNLVNAAEALAGPSARTSDLASRARDEGRAVFAAAGLSCTTDAEFAARRADLVTQPTVITDRPGGSTWQSLARGATVLETDYLNGEIALLGRIHGVATPVNVALQALAADAARDRRPPGVMPLDELVARVEAGVS